MKAHFDFMIRTIGQLRFGIIWLVMAFSITESAAMEINVNPDRNPVRFDEAFTLTFTANRSPDDEPDFSGLNENFEILNQSQSSNISLINGDFSRSVSWTLTLIAKKTGRLIVPPVPFGRDRSNSLEIDVLSAVHSKPDEDADILLEVSAHPENPYVQAQVIYTVQFLRRVDIAQASLTEPDLENAIIQKLGDDRSFSVRRNGHQYAVTERRYAIFPQESGLVAIPPLELKADILTSGRVGFFDRRSTHMRRIQSNAVALDVRPVPEGFKGNNWLPAEQVVLEEEWSNSPPSVRVGEPLTRTLKLTATGAPLSLLPEFGKLRFNGQQDNVLKQYPDQPALEEKKYSSGIVGSRAQKVALIPSSPGTFQSEAQEIAWWNTRTDRMEIARLPGITIKALPSATPEVANSPTVGSAEPGDLNNGPSQSTGSFIPVSAGRESGKETWFWVSVLLALGWGSTLVILARKKFTSKGRQKPEESPQVTSDRHAVRALKKACQNNSPLDAKDALLAWGCGHWPQSPPRSLDALAAICEGKLGREIRNLSGSLYGRERDAWNGAGCWEAFSNYAEHQSKPKHKNRDVALEPLFKA